MWSTAASVAADFRSVSRTVDDAQPVPKRGQFIQYLSTQWERG